MTAVRPRVARLLVGLCLLGAVGATGYPATAAAADVPPSTTISTPATLPHATTSTAAPPASSVPATTTTSKAPAIATTTTTPQPTTTAQPAQTKMILLPASPPTPPAPAEAPTRQAPAPVSAPAGAAEVTATPSSHGTVSLDAGLITYTPDPGFSGLATFDYTVCEASAPGSAERSCANYPMQVTVTPDGAVVDDLQPPPVDPTVPTSLQGSTAFLYTGENPVQRGVAPDAIERRRAAVLRGAVRDVSGAALAGVRVTIQDHAELGETTSRASGLFDLAVNGGGSLVVLFDKEGLLPASRTVDVPWGDYRWVPEVVLVPPDPVRMSVDAPDPTPATTAFRRTQYPMRPGDTALPASPPAGARALYAFEVSANDTQRSGDGDARPSTPIVEYVDNVPAQPVGRSLPLSHLDRGDAAWRLAAEGRVVAVVGVDDGGRALVDADGDGDSDGVDADVLAGLGVDDGERARLGRAHPPGTTVWRLALDELGAWSVWQQGPDSSHPAPDLSRATVPVTIPGSVSERLAVAGTAFVLAAAEDARAASTISIPVTGDVVPTEVEAVEVVVTVAGTRRETLLPPTPRQTFSFTWDGRDGYGRAVRGRFPAVATITHLYGASHVRGESSSSTVPLAAGGPAGQDLGGWRITAHDTLDIDRQVLYEGDGPVRDLRSTTPLKAAATAAGLEPTSIAAAPDGSLYVSSDNRVLHIGPDGVVTPLAGSGAWGFDGDGGPAIKASFRWTGALAVGGDGSVYVIDTWNARVRRIDPAGMITTVAGDGVPTDASPATDRSIGHADDIAVGPDGTLFVLEGGRGRVLEVSADGRLRVRKNLGLAPSNGPGSIAVAPDGTLFVSDPARQRVLRVPVGGSPAPLAEGQLSASAALVAGRDGTLTVLDGGRLLRLDDQGALTTITADMGSNRPRDVTVGPDGVLDLATDHGVVTMGGNATTVGDDGSIVVSSGDQNLVFDLFGRQLRTTDALTGTVRAAFKYDSQGRLSEIVDAAGASTRVVRSEPGAQIALVAPAGERTAVPVRTPTVAPSVRSVDIPAVMFKAYQDASNTARARLACDIRWSVLAAIGKSESNHGRFGGATILPNGDISPAIIGIALDGGSATERIPDTDRGALDGDVIFDRAVGPMQILPSTWRGIAADGNGDGVSDVHNAFDASLAAARYLCGAASGGSLSGRSQLAQALYSYNHSSAYVARLLADVDRYDSLDPAVGAATKARYALPVDRVVVDSDPTMLRRPHHGYPAVDLPLPVGSQVYAVAGGTVTAVTRSGDCGTGVVVDAWDGFRYTYCHGQSVTVGVGVGVAAGQRIMVSGNTGHSTGPHLHLQIERSDGTKVCPQPLLVAWERGQWATPASAPTVGCSA